MRIFNVQCSHFAGSNAVSRVNGQCRCLPERGFTLVEMLLVFALMVIMITMGIASFTSYGKRQDLQTAVSGVTSYLNLAKSRSASQVKPSQCGIGQLQGYIVGVTVGGGAYTLRVACGGSSYLISSDNLPKNITFLTGSSNQIFFNVLDGTAVPGSILVGGNGMSKTISVDVIGTIKVL
jgi:Tfp pilus assembly protein FimT